MTLGGEAAKDGSATCPALDLHAHWDDPEQLRGAILSPTRLSDHARELARSHGRPTRRGRPGLVHRRFQETQQRIRGAYEVLNRDLRTVREPAPAEEWLLDNVHIVEDQLREVAVDLPRGYLAQLPRLSRGARKGVPRVYALCHDYLRHTDAKVEPGELIPYVTAYQTVEALTIGELWAVPIMLRIVLLMTVAKVAHDHATDDSLQRARAISDQLSRATSPHQVLEPLSRTTLRPALLVELKRKALEQEGDNREILAWIDRQAHALGTTVEELSRLAHLRRAEDQLTIGNAITSMRALSAYDWSQFFSATSLVEAILSSDPAEAYLASDTKTRDRMRHAVERLARRNRLDERDIARAAIRLSERALARDEHGVEAHVGYYLIDQGRVALERELGARPPWRDRASRVVESFAHAFYFIPAAILLAGLLAAASFWLDRQDIQGAAWGVFLVGLLIPASDLALGVVNSAVMGILAPRVLPKLDLTRGIPDSLRTLVVVPTLLDSSETIQRLASDLEIRALANADANLTFALLTDFCDAASAETADDARLLAEVRAAIAALNTRHPRSPHPRFALLHRRRTFNASEGCYMGWERKRGKLEELNRLLLNQGTTNFSIVDAPLSLLRSIRYVITLDTDTELPRGVARKLVATLAHPLNRPVLAADGRRVIRGYALLQPRVGTTPASSRRSAFARIFAGSPGIDPYTTAVSDVYQDLFGEGSYVGKGIYDVRAFAGALDGRVPENTLLSHDLFEGLFARCALASDIEVFDDQPSSYAVEVRRQHRWIRGDYQLIPALFRESGLSLHSRWKVVDNLRRALLGPSLVFVVLMSIAWVPRAAPLAVLACLLVVASPVLVRSVAHLARPGSPGEPHRLPLLWGDFHANALRSLVQLVFLLDGALVALDAVARTLYRITISRRHLLEWTSTSQTAAESRKRRLSASPRMLAGTALAIGMLAWAAHAAPLALTVVLPLCGLWAIAPFVAESLSRPRPAPSPRASLDERERAFARRVARKTWRFFETFVGDEDHHLPPDNFQEEPRGVLAHRTSPTNIGLYLLSCLSARDLGYLTTRRLLDRTSATLDAIDTLETYRGHLLNWYDTSTLRPLAPKYVSMVDSGNLLGHLWTLAAGYEELLDAPFDQAPCIQAVTDALLLAREHDVLVDAPLALLGMVEKSEPTVRLGTVLETLRLVCDGLPVVRAEDRAGAEHTYWLSEARRTAAEWLDELEQLAPFGAMLVRAPTRVAEHGAFKDLAAHLLDATSVSDLGSRAASALPRIDALRTELRDGFLDELRERVVRSAAAVSAMTDRVATLASRARTLADRMDFAFLYDEERALFSIGYSVDSGHLDGSRYDLLASEARLGSFVAIAKGDVPEKHWFHLGRARVRARGQTSLVAWSGSMFEYLMPLLVMERHEGTLLDETYAGVVRIQRAHGATRGVPWGISESAYNVMDLHMTYQYRAFGVPALGLKAGLGDDTVIAPYATALAALVAPSVAIDNLLRLARDGYEGPCGFYEAIDFTPERVPPGRRAVVVKAYMAHHQGMTLVSLANVLLDGPMQRRFHSDPRVKATALLLEERAPLGAPVSAERVIQEPVQTIPDDQLSHLDRFGLHDESPHRAHLLGHGELATLVGARGFGFTTWRGLDVQRSREERNDGPTGTTLYLRDVATGKVWSAGYEPTLTEPDDYVVEFSPDKVRIQRRDGAIESVLEVVVSPEFPAELRQLTLTNLGPRPVDIEVTSYMELVLAPHGADLAHPAFSNMFVCTERCPERAGVIATRTPRKRGEFQPWCLQTLEVAQTGAGAAFEFDTSRVDFLGRGGSYRMPAALRGEAPLAGKTGYVLDPVVALRRTVRLAPGSHTRLHLLTCLASSREGTLAIAEALGTQQGVTRTFELAWADARVELKHLGISGLVSHRFQRLLSALLSIEPELRHGEMPSRPVGGLHTLWSLGISGDLPLLVVRLDDLELNDLVRDVLLAHEFFRLNNVAIDLLLWDEEPAGYLSPVADRALQVVRATASQGLLDQRGGVFVRKAHLVSPDERTAVLATARVVLSVSRGSLARQLRRPTAARVEAVPAPLGLPRSTGTSSARNLTFATSYGGFSDRGREYVSFVSDTLRPPTPWSNVMARESFGALVTAQGGGFVWSGNSQRDRLTPWRNDAVLDPPGHVIYLRNDDTSVAWSATPAPRSAGAEYVVRHGQGYSVFESTLDDVHTQLTLFLHPERSAQVLLVRLRSTARSTRSLSLFGFVDWALGPQRERTRHALTTSYSEAGGALLAENLCSTSPGRTSYFVATSAIEGFTGDRSEFIGESGSLANPSALGRKSLSGRTGGGVDPCGALHVRVRLEPEGEYSIAFVLGEEMTRSDAQEACARLRAETDWEATLDRSRAFWDDVLGHVTVSTPDPALDILVNRWLVYQTLSCRIWGRSAFYQSGGAYGYRDQLQDVLALLHAKPELARAHILRAAQRQFREGDVQHWWHPETGEGVRTRCSDDMLWLPFSLLRYLTVTGDESILDESLPFLEERKLTPEDHDLYSVPRVSEERASLYEHARRALLCGTTQGPHGLPLMGTGDWNDGMDRLGVQGTGESVWLAWFLASLWRDFGVLAQRRGDAPLAERAEREVRRLGQAADEHAWDGAWYRRAFTDLGQPVGTHQADECRIDAIAQSWAVLSGAGDPDRARTALDSSLSELLLREYGMLRLLWPPFRADSPLDPGYIGAYPPGIRENGGQYTHGILWTVQALLRLDEADRAFELLSMLNPIHQTDSDAGVARYQTEPYAIAADIYAAPDHLGRGGWTWYTGAAGWFYRIVLEDMLGIHVRGETLTLRPRVPRSWPRYDVTYRRGAARYVIRVENAQGVELGAAELRVELDGTSVPPEAIPFVDDGREHVITVHARAASIREARRTAGS